MGPSASLGNEANTNTNGGTDSSNRMHDNSIHNGQQFNIGGPPLVTSAFAATPSHGGPSKSEPKSKSAKAGDTKHKQPKREEGGSSEAQSTENSGEDEA